MIFWKARPLFNAIHHYTSFGTRKKSRNLVKYTQYTRPVARLYLLYIIPVQCQYVSFFHIGHFEVPVVLQIRRQTFRHTAHNHVLAEQQHSLGVNPLFQRYLFIKALADICHQWLFIHSPSKLLKVHGVHKQCPLFRRNGNIIYILLYGDQRARLYIVEPSICNQILYRLPGFRKLLYLIKYDNGFFWIKPHTIFRRKNKEKGVEIIHVIVKGRNNRVTNFVEIYHKIAPVFILCELFHKGGFTYPSGAFYQKRLSACRLLFPDKQFVI